MTKSLPIIHSVIDSKALAKVITSSWNLNFPIHCELLTRGMNDVYLIRESNGLKWACRVWRSNFRSEEEISYETKYLEFLNAKELSVSEAHPTRDGLLYVSLNAIEGKRFCSLFRWVEGEAFGKKPDNERSYTLGQTIGKMHNLSLDFNAKPIRNVDSVNKMKHELCFLERMLFHREGEYNWYKKAINLIENEINKLSSKIPFGPCHGDFHLYNAFFNKNEVTLLDFDNCGFDYFIADLNSFLWANDYVDVKDKSINENFLSGYKSIRLINEIELSLMPLFYAAKEIRFLCGFAANVNAVGHSSLLNPNLDWFYDRTKKNILSAGLI